MSNLSLLDLSSRSLTSVPQEEDVQLPDVPTEPLPEVPEAANAQPGKHVCLPMAQFHIITLCVCVCVRVCVRACVL